MFKETRTMFAIRFNNGSYWIGYGAVSSNLGKAQLYSSTKHAEEAAKKLLESIDNILVKDAQVNVPITSFKIVSVNKTEIREVSDI